MSDAAAKGNLSAFQRWEMASFDDDRPSFQRDQKLATAQQRDYELDSAREAARLEGYAAGYKEGFASAYQEGMQSGLNDGQARVNQEIAAMTQLFASFSAQITAADENVGQDLLNLAIDLAKAVVKSSLEIDPDLIVPIVREAIELLPSLQQTGSVLLHPDDADLVRQHMGGELEKFGWRIVIDHHIDRGGCLLDTPQNLIDASLATRWTRLSDALLSARAPTR